MEGTCSEEASMDHHENTLFIILCNISLENIAAEALDERETGLIGVEKIEESEIHGLISTKWELVKRKQIKMSKHVCTCPKWLCDMLS